MFETIISVYAPHHCVVCGGEPELLCASCLTNMVRAIARCYRCRALSPGSKTCKSCRRASSLLAVRAATNYEREAKDIVVKLKFSGARMAASTMADMLCEFVPSYDWYIVPVPTASSRVRLRGYDQGILIAKALAQKSNAAYLPCLLRKGQHRQVGANRTERLRHTKNSFFVNKDVAGKSLMLVDDVMTTGATLESAAAELKAAGAKRVEAVVFARA